MRVVVPFDARRPKTRLAPALDEEERAAFAGAMLEDVVATLATAGVDPEVLSTAPVDPTPGVVGPDRVAVTVDERPLNDAVDAVLAESLGGDGSAGDAPDAAGGPGPGVPAPLPEDPDDDREPVAVVMADLALATPDAVERLLSASGDVVLVPGRAGGTNAIVARHPGFRVDYHGASYRDHREAAERLGAMVETVDSYCLSTDVDEREDLAEVLLHGRPRSRQWLLEHGFRLATDEQERVTVVRDGGP